MTRSSRRASCSQMRRPPAKKFPNTQFAITDYPVEIPPFSDKTGS